MTWNYIYLNDNKDQYFAQGLFPKSIAALFIFELTKSSLAGLFDLLQGNHESDVGSNLCPSSLSIHPDRQRASEDGVVESIFNYLSPIA